MKNLKKILSVILVLTLALSMIAVLAGCKENTPDATEPSSDSTGATGTYNVTVTTAGGMAMEGLDIYVYADNTLADLKDYGKTDAAGKASFSLSKSSDYAIAISGAPKGYDVKPSYSFSGNTAKITLTSSVITDDSLSNVTLGLGDVMVDFTVTSVQGEEFTLSEVLKEKKMALINFFFTTCGPCANEFPYMDEAYQMFSDDVAVIALDPLEQDAAVSAYQTSMGLSFPMAACPAAWSQTFGITGYPTSVVVDQYGVICLIEVGGITSLRPFASIFEHFTAEDYEQKICVNGVNDVITVMKPTYEMPASEEIAAVINRGDIAVSYRPETGNGAEYSWPFIITEKNGEACIKASNSGVEDSYAILYADVELKAGQAVAFDYLVSSENGNDVLVVIVDGEDIYQMSGVDAAENWKTCYPWVAKADGTYEVAIVANGKEQKFTVTVDATAPTLKIEGVENGGSTKGAVIISDVSSDATMKVYLDDVQIDYTAGDELTEVGKYRIVLEDAAGNVSEYSFEILWKMPAVAIVLIVIAALGVVGTVVWLVISKKRKDEYYN